MSKVQTILLAVLFSSLICTCGILVIGFSPNHHMPFLVYLILPIAFPVLILILLLGRKEIVELPEKRFALILWQRIFYIFGFGTIIWLLFGMFAFDMGHYHCEFESGFMTDNDVSVPYVNRSVGVSLSMVFGLGWIVLAQKPHSRTSKVNSVLALILTITTICLGIFLFCEPDVECIVYGG